MRRGVLILTAMLFFPIGGSSAAFREIQAPRHHVAALRLTISSDRPLSVCSRRVPDSWTVAAWVYSNGRELHSTISGETYYAGHGTLVQLVPHNHGGPICAKAMTWQPQARVLVAFKVL